MNKKIIWTISGSDCSGGAGIAADIKTAQGLGMEICTLITANTVQNSQQLISVNPVGCDILQQQANCLLVDKIPSVIKIGLLVNIEQVTWLITLLRQIKITKPQLKVIYDPVGQASVGGALSQLSPKQLTKLLPHIDIITPNLIEAKQLTNDPTDNPQVLAQKISALGIAGVIIKGGHSDDKCCVDLCLDASLDLPLESNTNNNKIYQLSSPRINTNHSHGGGCSFATALACFIGQHYLLRDAFTLAKAFINQGLIYAYQNEKQQSSQQNKKYGAFVQLGWPTNKSDFPKIQQNLDTPVETVFKSLALSPTKKLGLYPVVDSIAWLKRLLPLNLEIIQLRLKNHSIETLDNLIQQAVALSKNYPTRVFINDYWQLAIKHQAYGVHIGQEDLQETDLTAIKQAGLCLGISTHGCYEFLLAQQLKPSYLAIGAIFPTKTKNMTGQIQGINNLQHLLKLAEDIPVVAIGGINLERAKQVWQTGVDAIAVVTAITQADAPEKAIKTLQTSMY
jgi:hydroxymethylpyrimidine kinase/phosphomethylpyrimidine kinase/thiamine-phosphate diphosphorylase